MERSLFKSRRLDVFGDSMLNKLPGRSRKKRKREASKKRRAAIRKENAQVEYGVSANKV